MELLEFLTDLAAIPQTVWIVGYQGGLVSENTPEGMRAPVQEQGSITVQAASWHFHLDGSLITEAHLSERAETAPGVPNRMNRRVLLANADGRSPLRVYIQSSEALERLCAAWQGRAGVRVTRTTG
jgi:hypothetical protein